MTYNPEKEKIFYIIIIALSLFRLTHQLIKFFVEKSFIDLAYHYYYSTMVRFGFDLFDPQSIEKAKTLIPLRHAGGSAVYSPSYFFFFQPLTFLPFQTLSFLWLIFSILLVFFSVSYFLVHTDWDGSLLAPTFIIFLITYYQPLYEDLALGQNNSILLIFAVGMWYGTKYQITWLSSLSIAVMAFLKIQFAFLIVFLFLFKEWKRFLISSMIWISLFFSGLPKLGIAHYEKYVIALFKHTSNVAADLQNISFNGTLNRLIGDGNVANISYIFTSLIIVILILFFYYRYQNNSSEIISLILLTTIPLLSPHTEEHHLLTILLPLLFPFFHLTKISLFYKYIYISSIVIIASRYSWIRFVSTTNKFLSPLLSLKILGVFLLLIVLLNIHKNSTDLYTEQISLKQRSA